MNANAAVVGVLLAALYSPVITEGVQDPVDVALALLAFGLLACWKTAPWIVIVLMAGTGQVIAYLQQDFIRAHTCSVFCIG